MYVKIIYFKHQSSSKSLCQILMSWFVRVSIKSSNSITFSGTNLKILLIFWHNKVDTLRERWVEKLWKSTKKYQSYGDSCELIVMKMDPEVVVYVATERNNLGTEPH